MNPKVVERGVAEFTRSERGLFFAQVLSKGGLIGDVLGGVFEAGVIFTMKRLKAGAKQAAESQIDKQLNDYFNGE